MTEKTAQGLIKEQHHLLVEITEVELMYARLREDHLMPLRERLARSREMLQSMMSLADGR